MLLYAVTGLLPFGALLATAYTDDRLLCFHGWIFLAAFVAALAAMTIGLSWGPFRAPETEYADGVIRAGAIATKLTLALADTASRRARMFASFRRLYRFIGGATSARSRVAELPPRHARLCWARLA